MQCNYYKMRSFVSWLFMITISISRHDVECKFAEDFIFGSATSSYQVEGAWNDTDKGVSVWDDFTHKYPNKIFDGTNGDVVADSFHFYKEDVAALKAMGAKMYRFSISWPRLLPNGFVNYISEDGKAYYNKLIDELLKNDIEPFVTLYHWDLPERLQQIGGLTNRAIVDLFVDYARFAFQTFGDRVKYWATFNEPVLHCTVAFAFAIVAPGVKLPDIGQYLCVHNILLSHAYIYQLYDEEFRHSQNGNIGIINHVIGYEPKSNSAEDILAANLAQEYLNGWIMNPIFSHDGDYHPALKEMLNNVSKQKKYPRSRLPEFSDEEIDLLKDSADFYGVNHYTTAIASFEVVPDTEPLSFFFGEDIGLYIYQPREWKVSSDSPAVNIFKIYPKGLRQVLLYLKDKYNNPPLLITESGMPTMAGDSDLIDHIRVEYLNEYLSAVHDSIEVDGVNLIGFLVWSLIDCFEWQGGLTYTFGLHKVNFSSPQKERIRRLSSHVYQNIIETREIDWNYCHLHD